MHEQYEEKRHQASLEAEQAAILHAEQEARLRVEWQRWRVREESKKSRLLSYHQRKVEEKKAERMAEEELRLEVAALNMKKLVSGHGRVSYRKKLYSDKLTQQKLLQARKQVEQREREQQLDLLRQQVLTCVCVDVEGLHWYLHVYVGT